MTVGERIKHLRDQQAISQTELASLIRSTKQNVYKYENGIISNIPSDKIEAIAKVLHTTPAYLMGWIDDESYKIIKDNLFTVEIKKFPLLGNIACGEPILADEQFEAYVEAGANIKADFCLRAKGDSMIGARIQDGDIVFIRKQDIVDDGDIAAILIDDEVTLKRMYYDRDNGILQLFAENPKYKIMRFSGEELNHIRILGKAIAFQSDI